MLRKHILAGKRVGRLDGGAVLSEGLGRLVVGSMRVVGVIVGMLRTLGRTVGRAESTAIRCNDGCDVG
jgi:hypothetical protein